MREIVGIVLVKHLECKLCIAKLFLGTIRRAIRRAEHRTLAMTLIMV